MSPTLIHYHMGHSSFFPCLPVTSYYNSKKCDAFHLSSIQLIVQISFTCIGVSELLINISAGSKFINQITLHMGSSFIFSLRDSTHFQSYLDQHTPPSPSRKLFYTFVIQLDHFVPFYIPSWNTDLLNRFKIYIIYYSLFVL